MVRFGLGWWKIGECFGERKVVWISEELVTFGDELGSETISESW